jgi:hypothetical protein
VRVLLFTGRTFDLILTIELTSRGRRVGGTIFSDRGVSVEIRRPLRATIALAQANAGTLIDTIVPAGPARIVISGAGGETHESNWLTL